jgi:hypothetical protein
MTSRGVRVKPPQKPPRTRSARTTFVAEPARVYVVELTMPDKSPAIVRSVTRILETIAPLAAAAAERRQEMAWDKLVELLTPVEPLEPHLVIEAQMRAAAQTSVLESGDWLTSAQIAKLAGFSDSNPSAQPSKWKRDGLIFSIAHKGTDYFPGYGLDADDGYRPRAALATVLEVFKGRMSAWAIAIWFAALNSGLGGERPQDVLESDPERVIAAARDLFTEIDHA